MAVETLKGLQDVCWTAKSDDAIDRWGSTMQPSQLDELYAQVADEVANGRLQNGLWHRMFSEADGDEKVARARYLRERVKQLQAETAASVPLLEAKADVSSKLSDHRILADLNVTEILPACHGLAKFEVTHRDYSKNVLSRRKNGYLDLDGNIKIQPLYSYASSFVKGFAYVSLEDGLGPEEKERAFGVIDTTGAYVVLPNYQSASIENKDIYLQKGNSSQDEFIFDPRTNDVRMTKSRKAMGYFWFGSKETVPLEFSSSWAKWPWNKRFLGKFGFADRQGKWVVPAKYDEAIAFKNGRGFVGVGPEASRKFFMIDVNGKPVSTVEYDKVHCFWGHEGDDVTIAHVINCGKTGYVHIDHDGNPMYSSRFSGLHRFNEFGVATAAIGPEKNLKGGLINRQGHFVLQPKFDNCHHLIDDLACVYVGEYCGIMNFSEEWLVKPHFANIARLHSDTFVLEKRGDLVPNPYSIKKYAPSSWFLIDRSNFGSC